MKTNETLACETRTLNPEERAALSKGAADFRARGRGLRALVPGVAVIGVLWVLTLLASDSPWLVVTLFWGVIGGGILLWVWRDVRRDRKASLDLAKRLESALIRDLAEVYVIRARAYAELEEFEDEGACYAFDLGGDRLVFVTGQEFYPDERFPSLDFSLVYPLDRDGWAVDCWIEPRGDRAGPDRVISAETKWDLEIPGHLSLVRAGLEGIEEALRADPQQENQRSSGA